MEDIVVRVWDHLVGRLTGPLTVRLFLQPAVSTLLAIRDGLRDAQAGHPPFLWTIFTRPDDRRPLIYDGIIATAKLAVMALILDFVYQLIVFRRIYPVEAIDVAVVLAIVPYFVLRGLINRTAVMWRDNSDVSTPSSRPVR
jgi:hypothetical protein